MTTWRPQNPGSAGDPGDWSSLPPPLLQFWTERHLVTLTTLRADGRPHVVPVGIALDTQLHCAWAITSGGSRKARNLLERPDSHVAACQVDGARWSTIEGTARVLSDAETVAYAEARYAERYRVPQTNPARVAVRIDVLAIMHSARL